MVIEEAVQFDDREAGSIINYDRVFDLKKIESGREIDRTKSTLKLYNPRASVYNTIIEHLIPYLV